MYEVSVPELINEHKDELLEELAALKEKRSLIPRLRDVACVYMAGVTTVPRSKDNPNPSPVVGITVFNISNGHNKKASIINMARRGKFPIGYDFPTDERLNHIRTSLKKTPSHMITRSEARQLQEEDPYYEMREYVELKKGELLDGWKSQDTIEDQQAQIRELEKRLLSAEKHQADKEAKKQPQASQGEDK